MSPTRWKLGSALHGALLVAATAPGWGWTGTVSAQECMLGEVRYFAGRYAPRSWALANGQLLSIRQNPALFSILSTTYGGDGRETFGLPDLRGQSAVGAGDGPGLSSIELGQKGGAETATLHVDQAPSSSRVAPIDSTAGSEAVSVRGPYQALNPIICMQGIFPSRN